MHATHLLALDILRAGGVVAMPTDTVYGLHCLPQCIPAIEKILTLKQRSKEKGLILVAGNLELFAQYIQPLPAAIAQKIRANPGVTWIVPARPGISTLITGQFSTVAIRICHDLRIAALSQQLHSPLISTSANIAHHPVAKNAQEVKHIFPSGLDLIIEGASPENALASEIRDAYTDARLR